jgi:hypothetical protein
VERFCPVVGAPVDFDISTRAAVDRGALAASLPTSS